MLQITQRSEKNTAHLFEIRDVCILRDVGFAHVDAHLASSFLERVSYSDKSKSPVFKSFLFVVLLPILGMNANFLYLRAVSTGDDFSPSVISHSFFLPFIARDIYILTKLCKYWNKPKNKIVPVNQITVDKKLLSTVGQIIYKVQLRHVIFRLQILISLLNFCKYILFLYLFIFT